jgi:hypothetical protein
VRFFEYKVSGTLGIHEFKAVNKIVCSRDPGHDTLRNFILSSDSHFTAREQARVLPQDDYEEYAGAAKVAHEFKG